MYNVSVAQAKAHLGKLLNQVEAGEEILITRRGQPVARLLSEKKLLKLQPLPSLANFRATMTESVVSSADLIHLDFEEMDRLRASLPVSTMSSAELIRQMRDEGY